MTGVLLPGAMRAVRAVWDFLEGPVGAPKELVVNATLASLDYTVIPALERYRTAGGRAVTVTADQNPGQHTLHALWPDFPRRHITGTSHYLASDKPAEFNAILDEALSGALWVP